VRLVQKRGQAMEKAASAHGANASGMVSVLGSTAEDIKALLVEMNRSSSSDPLAAAAATTTTISTTTIATTTNPSHGMVVANRLAPGNTVLAGDLAGCARVQEVAVRDFGASKVIQLQVAGAFHSP